MVDFLYCGKTFSNENGLKKVDHCDPSNQSENYEKFEDEDEDDKAIEEKSGIGYFVTR
jgi:hypothetical protein